MYQDAIEKTYTAHTELVGLCDVNPGRVELARARSVGHSAPPPPAYAAVDFERNALAVGSGGTADAKVQPAIGYRRGAA